MEIMKINKIGKFCKYVKFAPILYCASFLVFVCLFFELLVKL